MIRKGLDLTPLDPDRDPAWRERLVETVMTSVRHDTRVLRELHFTPARMEESLLSDLLAFTRPALAAAFASAALIIAVSSVAASGSARREEVQSPRVGRYPVAEALGMPEALASWVEGGRAPSTGELLSTLGGY